MPSLFWIIVAVVLADAVLIGVFVHGYNRLVSLRQQVRAGRAQIDVQLQRRLDLLPELVRTAQGVLQHEEKSREAVERAGRETTASLRSAADSTNDADAVARWQAADSAISVVLERLRGIVARDPAARTNEAALRLLEELASTENRVAFARQAYNDHVHRYNRARASFPQMILASWFSFDAIPPFERPSTRKTPTPRATVA